MKHIKSIFGGMLIIIFIIFSSMYFISKWLDSELQALDNKNVEMNNGIAIKDNGLYLIQRSLRHGDILMIGSSELSAPVEQNPVNMYPNNDLSVNINKIGGAHRESLLDAILLGGLDVKPENKISILISLQWFEGNDINKQGFQAKFSELQFLSFLKNQQITDESKKYVCSRLTNLLSNEPLTIESCLWARLNATDDAVTKIIRCVFEPYYEFKYKILVLKDKYDAYKFLRDSPEKEYIVRDIDWKKEMDSAYIQGETACTNNDFFVYNEYYNKYLLDKIDNLAGRDVNTTLLSSKEVNDYEELLKVSKEKSVKPYYVIMSTNGLYYDYVGQNRSRRIELYDLLREEAQKNDMPYLDLREYEYEPYFYCDVSHLGWKGWIFVNENISKYFANK